MPRYLAPLFVAVLLAGATAQAADIRTSTSEPELIEALRTAEPADKAMACKRLTIYGGPKAVPELAKLLPDEHLASWARIALEAIPGPEADQALRNALDGLNGRLLVGTINSIGVRRDAKAVEPLSARLNDDNPAVAAAAAVALGHIGNAAATTALRQSLATVAPAVRSAVAEGCILCAERLMADGKHGEAVAVYDQVAAADVPKQRVLEATRGAVLARKVDGIPLLLEQLKSTDKQMLQMALMIARELPGSQVSDALAAEVASAPPARAALLLYAIGDRPGPLPSAVLQSAKSGPKPVRRAAIGVVGQLGDAASLDTLLAIATEDDAELAEAAKKALASLGGKDVNREIANQLANAEGKKLAVLVELVGERRIDATAPLVKALDSQNADIRRAALTALGETAGPKELAVLVERAVKPTHAGDAEVAQHALRAAAVRMPDREASASQLSAALPKASTESKLQLLETLGAMGGPKALETIAGAAKTGDDQLQDAASRLLGEWMSADAGPALLDIAKTADSEKYQVRALRGYIRLARQFDMPVAERAARCEKALAAAKRVDEQKLVLAVLDRYASPETLKVAVKAQQIPQIKDEAARVAASIEEKLRKAGSR
jgi:HEAT repeat protein